MAFDEDDVVTELVSLAGDEGVGSFLGSICFQYSSGNLNIVREKWKQEEEWRARTCALKNLTCFVFRLLLYSKINMANEGRASFNSPKISSFRECVVADMLSNVWRLPTWFVWGKVCQTWDWFEERLWLQSNIIEIKTCHNRTKT